MKPEVTDVLIEALRGPFKMRIVYGETDAETRTVEPHGLLLGLRSYLVARQADRGENLRHFRLDRIHSAECLDESFPIQSGFSLNDHAAQRSEEHTSELQSLMRISYDVFCLKKNNTSNIITETTITQ